jgi:hypothetical protein
LEVRIRGRSRRRCCYILCRNSDWWWRRRSGLPVRQSPGSLWRFYRRLWWGNDLDSLLGLPILCLWRCCSIPVLACFRIRPSWQQRMLTLWHRDMEVVYRAIIGSAGLRSAKRVARHAEGGVCARYAVRCFRRPVVVCTDAGCVRFVWRENMEFAWVKARSPTVSPEDPPNVASSRDVRWELCPSSLIHPTQPASLPPQLPNQALRQNAS